MRKISLLVILFDVSLRLINFLHAITEVIQSAMTRKVRLLSFIEATYLIKQDGGILINSTKIFDTNYSKTVINTLNPNILEASI